MTTVGIRALLHFALILIFVSASQTRGHHFSPFVSPFQSSRRWRRSPGRPLCRIPPFLCQESVTFGDDNHGSNDRNDFDDDDPPSHSNRFPVISKIAGVSWKGTMQYASGPNLTVAPFVLNGTTRFGVADDGNEVTLESSVTFPNGKTRTAAMRGGREKSDDDSEECTAPFRLDPVDPSGPIYMVLTEMPPDTILFREVNVTSGSAVMTGSMTIVNDGEEMVQVSHEHHAADGGGGGTAAMQVWRMERVT